MYSIIIAPNAFKGSLSAVDAAQAISSGLKRSGLTDDLQMIPIADGGDGSLPVILLHLGGEYRYEQVLDPLGKSIMATWGFEPVDKIAIIELAEASGIRLMDKHTLNPLSTTTHGTGQLIRKAIDTGAREIYLTIGGSATVDAGMGILEALGVEFMIGNQQVSHITPKDFLQITSLNTSRLTINTPIKILCDVNNPLLGKLGAAHIFGPQKGADQYTWFLI